MICAAHGAGSKAATQRISVSDCARPDHFVLSEARAVPQRSPNLLPREVVLVAKDVFGHTGCDLREHGGHQRPLRAAEWGAERMPARQGSSTVSFAK